MKKRRRSTTRFVDANNKYHQQATRFREIYIKVENLEETQKILKEDLANTRINVPEIKGSEDELRQRVERFDENISAQKQLRRTEEAQLQDSEEELSNSRKSREVLVDEVSGLNTEAKHQQQRLKDREQLIRDIGAKFGIGNFGQEPLDGPTVLEFISRLDDLKRKQNNELEALQMERKSNRRNTMQSPESSRRQQRNTKLIAPLFVRKSRNALVAITKGESDLENKQELPGQRKIILGDIEEKTRRLEKLKSDFKTANYDEKLSENADKKAVAENKRDKLNQEFMMLNREAESRANLNLKRKEMKSKKTDIEETFDAADIKFKKLTGKSAAIDSIAKDIEDVANQKKREQEDVESNASTATGAFQQAEAVLSEKKSVLRLKQRDLRDAERKMKGSYEKNTLEESITDAIDQLKLARDEFESGTGAAKIYERLLKDGKQKKKCTACNRHMDDDELRVFEKYLKEEIKKSSNSKAKEAKDHVEDWEEEVARLQGLRPTQVTLDTLKFKDIPETEEQVAQCETAVEEARDAADRASSKLETIKGELQDVQSLRESGKTIARLQKEVNRLKQEVESLETELASTGSTKSTEDIQGEIDVLSSQIRALDKESNGWMRERDRQKCRSTDY
ncbi:hypothetical protein BT96DRAFT_163110 [Gymnopus androsaceus JB14]|uniref:Uncharacterized protein n=1 Tax=Gymnopus androsaceus JB14 TaxID=1447944 RepID=A0A6A4HBP8_9AGAR|nr:hypothetical protein BT96DRAFT_163110 [Gymnopus androsaceus JB14]